MDPNFIFNYNRPWAVDSTYKTSLTPDEEKKYKSLVDVFNKTKRPDDPINPDDPTYDMRGYFKKYGLVDPGSMHGHWPDTYKTPYHPMFSRESIYAKKDAPHWEGDVLVQQDGKPALGYLLTPMEDWEKK